MILASITMWPTTTPLCALAAVALLPRGHDAFFVSPPAHAGSAAAISRRGASACTIRSVKPLEAGAMAELTPEEDKLKARAAFADSPVLDDLMSALNKMRGIEEDDNDDGEEPAAAVPPSDEVEADTTSDEKV